MADASIPILPDSCNTCRFWLFKSTNPGFTTATTVIPETHWGICRYRPPVAYDNGETSGSLWPSVVATDWCGKHEARG